VTKEDLLEQLVGEIHDEFDVVERRSLSPTAIVSTPDSTFRDLDSQYNITLPEILLKPPLVASSWPNLVSSPAAAKALSMACTAFCDGNGWPPRCPRKIRVARGEQKKAEACVALSLPLLPRFPRRK